MSGATLDDLITASLLDGDVPPEIGDERFVVRNDSGAEWAARKLAAVRSDIDGIEQMWARLRGPIDDWRDREVEILRREESWFEGLLIAYLRRLRENDPDTKSRKLPSATVSSKAGSATVDVDKDTFVAWASEQRADLLRTKVEPDLTAVKQAVLRDGEALPGCTPVEGATSYWVTVTASADGAA